MLYILAEFLFVDLLLIHFLSLLFHDYINLFPLNDVESVSENTAPVKKIILTLINSIPALIVLILAIIYFGEWKPEEIRIIMFSYFTIWIIVIYLVWYRPYFFGTGDNQKLKYRNIFGRTHQILPEIGDNPKPNTLHLILHILFLINFFLMLWCGYNPANPF